MKRIAAVTLLLSLTLCALHAKADDKAPAPTKPQPKKTAGAPDGFITVKPGRLHVTASLDGVYESATMTPVQVQLDQWNVQGIRVLSGLPQGTVVKKGQPLIQFDTSDLDQIIADTKASQKLAETNIASLSESVKLADASLGRDQMLAHRNMDRTQTDYDHYFKVGRQMDIDAANQALTNAQNSLAYANEELSQLKKMYAADDLTEDTEEIILKRQKDAVDRVAFNLVQQQEQTKRTLTVFVPRRDEDWKNSLHNAKVNLEKAMNQEPLDLAQQKQTLAKAKYDYDRTKKVLAKLESDRKALDVTAETGGVLYYGRYEDGQWKDAAVVSHIIEHGGGLRPGAVVMTIVEPHPHRVRCDVAESMLYRVPVGATGWATATGYPDRIVGVKVDSIEPIAMEAGQYTAMLSLDGDAHVTAGMTCHVKVTAYDNAHAIAVPLTAVDMNDPLHPSVMVRGKDGKVEKRAVKLGWRDGKRVEITDGLAAGEVVREKAGEGS